MVEKLSRAITRALTVPLTFDPRKPHARPLSMGLEPEGKGFIGMNFNSLEYAWGQAPGSSLTTLGRNDRMRIARIPTSHERWVWGTGLGGALNAGYVAIIRALAARLRAEGYWVLLELHNNGRFDPLFSPPEGSPLGNYDRGIAGWHADSYVLGSTQYPMSALIDLWSRISAEFHGEIDAFGIMNEPHGLVGLNQIDNGNSFTGANWYAANGAVLTPNAGTDPYGGNNAWSMTSGSNYGFIGRAITIPAAEKTSAIWVRTLSGTAQFSLGKDYNFASTHTATTAWQKLDYTFTGGANGVEFSLNELAGKTVLIYMAQLNDGPTALDIGGSTTWQLAAQAAADAIRANDTNAYLVVNGDNFGNAGTWVADNSSLDVQDAQGRVIYDVHHYLDVGGTYATSFDTLGINDNTGVNQAAGVISFMETKGFRFIVGETGIPLEEPRYLKPFSKMIDAYQASPNCLGIVYWNVVAQQAGDPSWYPNAGGVSIQPSQSDQSRLALLKSKAKSGPFVPPADWYKIGALIDAHFAKNKFRFNGVNYASEAAWLTALGGTKTGIQRSFGPYVVGSELLPDGGFASGVDSWADAPTYAANGDPSQVSGALRLSYSGTNTLYRARRPTNVTADRAYLLAATALSHVGLTSISLMGSTNTDLGGGASINYTPGSLPQTKSVVFGPSTSTMYMGMLLNGAALNTSRVDIDNASVKEVYPYPGYIPGVGAASIDFTTPATAPAVVVLAQWGDDSERQRIRLQLGTDFHLHLIITRNGTQTEDIDLGTLVASTAYKLELSFAPSRVVAKVTGYTTKIGVSTTVPGLGKFWIGRSFTGEAWTGTIERVTIWPYERLPVDALWVEGDSYASGAGGISLTATAKGDGRAAVTTAVAGTDLTDQLARVTAQPGLRQNGVFLHWDGSPAGNNTVTNSMDKYRSIIAGLGHNRFVIVAPMRLPSATAGNNQLATDVLAALKAEWPNNVVDAQAILAAHATAPGDNANVAAGVVPASLLQADATHLTAAAMGYVWTEGVKPKLTANGW